MADYDGATISLTLQNGVGAGPFDLSAGATLNIPAEPAGRFVELALVMNGAGLIVTRIETENETAVADGEKVSIGGIVSSDGSAGLLVNGVPFSVDDMTWYEPASLDGRLLPVWPSESKAACRTASCMPGKSRETTGIL